jgi:protein-tyrosine phosphatase
MMIKVLFVCMGNICRSPTAQGTFEKVVKDAGLEKQIFIDSAGTHAYHIGENPDSRTQITAKKHGLDLSKQRARKVSLDDFEKFDYILAMDKDNYSSLRLICPDEHLDKIKLFLDYAPETGFSEVPDPYYGGEKGFELVFDLTIAASKGLLETIRRNHHF